jgi:hypothetical protein
MDIMNSLAEFMVNTTTTTTTTTTNTRQFYFINKQTGIPILVV